MRKIIVALFVLLSATATCTAVADDEVLFIGSYEQMNDDNADAQLRIEAWGSEVSFTLASLEEPRLYATGEIDPEKMRRSERGGVQLKTTLRQYDRDYNVTFSDDVTITLDQRPDSLYDLSVTFDNEPSLSAIQVLMEPRRMFLVHPDEHEMVNELPFNINKERPTMAAMLRELNRYVFMYELNATADYIKRHYDKDGLAEFEQITIDERNRFFSYSWGEHNLCLEGKCFKMSDGRLLLVLDQHEATYANSQRLRFFVIDPVRQTIAERMRHQMIPESWTERGDAIFQVRYATNGLVAVFDDGNGGLDVKTLRFDGKAFK